MFNTFPTKLWRGRKYAQGISSWISCIHGITSEVGEEKGQLRVGQRTMTGTDPDRSQCNVDVNLFQLARLLCLFAPVSISAPQTGVSLFQSH